MSFSLSRKLPKKILTACCSSVRFDRFAMFEFNMDEYLDEETDFVKESMDEICKGWDIKVCSPPLRRRQRTRP